MTTPHNCFLCRTFIVLVAAFLLFGTHPPAFAAVVTAQPSVVKTVYGYDSDAFLFLESRPAECPDGFWLRHLDPEYSENMRVVLAAAHAGVKLTVKAFDDQFWPLFAGHVCRVQSTTIDSAGDVAALTSGPIDNCKAEFRRIFPSRAKFSSPGNTASIGTNAAQNEQLPLVGRTSFTEKQARERITKEGFSDLEKLSLERSSVWRTRAMLNGCPFNVAMDFRGNIVAETAP